jgi:hypothetical protein
MIISPENHRISSRITDPGTETMVQPRRQHVHTLMTTDLHWQENGELHPEDFERLRERLLCDAALSQPQLQLLQGWMVTKQKQPA